MPLVSKKKKVDIKNKAEETLTASASRRKVKKGPGSSRTAYYIVAAVVVVALAVFGVAYYQTYVAPFRRAIITVDGTVHGNDGAAKGGYVGLVVGNAKNGQGDDNNRRYNVIGCPAAARSLLDLSSAGRRGEGLLGLVFDINFLLLAYQGHLSKSSQHYSFYGIGSTRVKYAGKGIGIRDRVVGNRGYGTENSRH